MQYIDIWGLTLVFSQYELVGTFNITLFILVDALVGVVAPLLLALAVIPLSRVIRFITRNKLNPKKVMAQVYSSISYKKDSDGINYWVIADTFYFPEGKETVDKIDRGYCMFCSKKPVSCSIFFIVVFSFLLSGAIFVDDFLVSNEGPVMCQDLSSQQLKSSICFTYNPLSLINCTENLTYSNPLVCYRFLTPVGGTSADLLKDALVESFVTFALSNALIEFIFQIVKVMFLIKRTKAWSVCVIISGVILLAIDIGLVIVSIVPFMTAIDTLAIYETLLIGIDITLVGALLYSGEPLEAIANEGTGNEDFPELHKTYSISSV